MTPTPKKLAEELRQKTNAKLRIRKMIQAKRSLKEQRLVEKQKEEMKALDARRRATRQKKVRAAAAAKKTQQRDWEKQEMRLAAHIIAELPQKAKAAAEDGLDVCLALLLQDGHVDRSGRLCGAAKRVALWAKKAGFETYVIKEEGILVISW